MKKVAMITGGSKGLGKALTLFFAREGYNLAICARNEVEIQKVKEKAETWGANVLAISADMSKTKDVERFVALSEEYFGRIDVLINNASILGPSPMPYLLDYPEQDFEEVLRVNTIGPFLVTRRVLPIMLQKQQGSIINITSEAGATGYAGWGAYGISKFALEGLTETWADEVNGSGVRVNMVDPGEMDTDMHERAVPDCDYELAKPEDVTAVFGYLASDASKHITGKRFEAEAFQLEGSEN
ncbi:SDR family NAD(P)-dependent oxidoreductase [Fictibacillus phosphorivorans]|uniref:SDR family NAD(P)-dependent oxidoreductase n=1 Tax=Fictibacillus phosphorivorans TaxID=1221500 RepID=UPI00203A6D2A|nr:SDR family oxidoreductase [Fictibacillus phosphorivorans]MCM3719411.1 SDR family oxidoreductase [Fictibacillus phosphorivorans]MCM3777111.1 SDR family oxidoreductase [Fictibacillus phosphorivorans]